MKYMAVIIFMLFSVSVSSVYGQEPPAGYKSVLWGATKEEITSQLPHFSCREATGADATNYDWSCYSLGEKVGSATVSVSLSGFNNLGFSSYLMSFEPRDFGEIRDAFVERFGKPHKNDERYILKILGRTLITEKADWEWTDLRANMFEHFTSSGKGALNVSTIKANAERMKRFKEKRKAGAGGF